MSSPGHVHTESEGSNMFDSLTRDSCVTTKQKNNICNVGKGWTTRIVQSTVKKKKKQKDKRQKLMFLYIYNCVFHTKLQIEDF